MVSLFHARWQTVVVASILACCGAALVPAGLFPPQATSEPPSKPTTRLLMIVLFNCDSISKKLRGPRAADQVAVQPPGRPVRCEPQSCLRSKNDEKESSPYQYNTNLGVISTKIQTNQYHKRRSVHFGAVYGYLLEPTEEFLIAESAGERSVHYPIAHAVADVGASVSFRVRFCRFLRCRITFQWPQSKTRQKPTSKPSIPPTGANSTATAPTSLPTR
jgi:hypothetical protein